MIGLLEGKIEFRKTNYLILNVGGVGYKIFCSQSTLDKLPHESQKVKLFTHLISKEGIFDLYGFLDFNQLELFELLISISGIGPKGALSILSVASVAALKKAIINEDKKILTKVSGIGSKTAERIILELRKKVSLSEDEEGIALLKDDEVIDALVSLGYSSSEARAALRKVPPEIKETTERVKMALKNLAK